MQKSTSAKVEHTDLSDLDLETVAAGKDGYLFETPVNEYLDSRRREYDHRRYEHRHYR